MKVLLIHNVLLSSVGLIFRGYQILLKSFGYIEFRQRGELYFVLSDEVVAVCEQLILELMLFR